VLPSQVLAEDVEIIQLLQIEDMAGLNESKGEVPGLEQ
jgi:hypothetical protein